MRALCLLIVLLGCGPACYEWPDAPSTNPEVTPTPPDKLVEV